jgi:hypothetical protein
MQYQQFHVDPAMTATLDQRLDRPAITVSLRWKVMKGLIVAHRDYMVIGVVRWGLEYGFLAISTQGNYVRVNGSFVELLDAPAVRAAIFKICAVEASRHEKCVQAACAPSQRERFDEFSGWLRDLVERPALENSASLGVAGRTFLREGLHASGRAWVQA